MTGATSFGRLALLTPFWRRFAAGVVAMLVAVSLQLAFPQALSRVVDGAVAGGKTVGTQTGLLIAGILLLMPIASALRYYLFESTGHRVSATMRRRLFGALIRKPVAFYDQHTVGELGSRLSGDTEAVHDSLMMTSA
ncbi:MAG: ABC transporter transmembrane domain-containing protein, partial [Dokdonella sp.]|uniref:ABC transporter transmembrane domain-containing protein n=1 Tax=Dokdonella sp. TaxID=2291710 RepID=UPI003F7EF1A5